MYGGALLIGIAHSSGPLSLGQVRWEALQAEANSRLSQVVFQSISLCEEAPSA